MSSKVVQSINLRRISAEDNAAIAHVIRRVSAEYGLTADKGYTVADPNLDELYQVYSQPKPCLLGGGLQWRSSRRWRDCAIDR